MPERRRSRDHEAVSHRNAVVTSARAVRPWTNEQGATTERTVLRSKE